MLKTPKTIGLLAVLVVLAAAVVSASGAFAKAPAHQSAAVSAPASESTTEAAEPAGTEANDAAGGHADDPNNPNADHQFNGEE